MFSSVQFMMVSLCSGKLCAPVQCGTFMNIIVITHIHMRTHTHTHTFECTLKMQNLLVLVRLVKNHSNYQEKGVPLVMDLFT